MSKYTMASNGHDLNNGQARFTVFGVGGGGGNAVEHMVQQGVKGVTFVCANTDKQALDRLTADNKLQLGAQTNRGLGAGANPEVGREAAEQDEDAIRELLKDSDMVFITAGMGGGTGTGAAPVVARIAKEMEILTVGVVTTPFKFEGGKRIKAAKAGIDALSNFVDSIITIPNDKLLKVYGNISMQEAFKKADDVLMHAVQGIAQTISSEGVINIDFNDIRTAMTAKGHAMMGIGRASGEDRARQATEKAIRSPLLDDLVLENAKGLIVNVVSSESVTLAELNEITEVVNDITDIEEANIFIGTVIDEKLGVDLHVTVI
ncbi:MAG TPA: cell division protein FtsZ, partial [Psychrobacter pasteurii]|nr:cell division protein FtsZ [Psychrobacter pasteurii]